MSKNIAYLLLACILMAVSSCNNRNERNGSSIKAKTNEAISTTKKIQHKKENPYKIVEEQAEVKFIIKVNEADDMPNSDISISVNGKITFLANITGLASIQNHIGGEGSITACGAWWGGAGDYFYVVRSANKIIIYQGWADEEQDDVGYHWEKKITIRI